MNNSYSLKRVSIGAAFAVAVMLSAAFSNAFAEDKNSSGNTSTKEKAKFEQNAETLAAMKKQADADDAAVCAKLTEEYFRMDLENQAANLKQSNESPEDKAKREKDPMSAFSQACFHSVGNDKKTKNLKKATELFSKCRPGIEKLANEGNTQAQKAMSVICRQANNEKQAALWLEKAAEKDSEAQFRMGLMYYAGVGGVDKDQAKAFEYFKKAADNGSPLAAVRLARIYREGTGTEKNIDKAKEYSRKAQTRN